MPDKAKDGHQKGSAAVKRIGLPQPLMKKGETRESPKGGAAGRAVAQMRSAPQLTQGCGVGSRATAAGRKALRGRTVVESKPKGERGRVEGGRARRRFTRRAIDKGLGKTRLKDRRWTSAERCAAGGQQS